MAENLCNEIKRLHKRKQLPITAAALERMQDSESSGSEMGPESPRRPDSPPNLSLMRHGEKALFTFKQVQLICESMLKERENQLRELYEGVLTTKLAEQYDAFVKFTYDQIQRSYEAAPSCEYFSLIFRNIIIYCPFYCRPFVRLCEELMSLTGQKLIIALRSYVTVVLPRQQQPSFKLNK